MFTSNRVFKHMEVVSNLHVLVMASGKYDIHIYFTFFTRILTSTHTKEFNIIFRIIYVAMSNIQISALDKFKMSCQTHKY